MAAIPGHIPHSAIMGYADRHLDPVEAPFFLRCIREMDAAWLDFAREEDAAPHPDDADGDLAPGGLAAPRRMTGLGKRS